MNKFYNWLKESNHKYHLSMIGLISLVNLFLLHSLDCSLIACFIGTLFTAAGISLSIEYIEKKAGGKIDGQDLLADLFGFVIAVFVFLLFKG